MELETFGFDPFFDESFRALGRADLEPARVVRADRGILRVQTATGVLSAQVAGRLLHEATDRGELPVVGDWVAIAREDHGTGAVVRARLPRASRICRQVAGRECAGQVIAANVSAVFVVCGLDLDFNPRRIERYLTLAWDSGSTPVVVLNKLDLAGDAAEQLEVAQGVAPGVEVVAIGARDGLGLDRLERWLTPGCTVALLGSSGAGKSTLVNRLLGREAARTGEIRESDGRGCHTTSHRELFLLPGGALLVDTPGLRELQLWADEDDLASAFADIENAARDCRFRDCGHDGEPGCAVRAAVESGALDGGRLASWSRLRRELDWVERRRDERSVRADARRTGRLFKRIKRSKREERG